MKNKQKVLIVMFTFVLGILVACGNSTDKLGANTIKQNEQENVSTQTSTNSNGGESVRSSVSDSEISKSKKDEYLKRLNDMEESDRNEEGKTTMVEMMEQEGERYKTWDKTLNEIYGVLKGQLNTEQMDRLRKEQRDWIKHRDELAKDASLKYEGGTMESLEYVATQASLTRERCYELVANYMK